MNRELSWQQKVWKFSALLIRAFRPAMLYLLLPSVFMGFGMLLGGKRSTDEIVSQSGSFYYMAGVLFCLWLFFKRRREQFLKEISFSLPVNNLKKILFLAGMGFAASVSVSALLTLLPKIPLLWGDYTGSTSSAFRGYDPVLTVITNVILAPIMEEAVFRGYMIKRLKEGLRQDQAVLIASAFFAVCHIYPVWIIYAFGMGLLLAWVALREDNIFYSMVLHISFNLAALPVTWINSSESISQLLLGSWWKLVILGAAAAAASAAAYRGYVKEGEL